MPRATRPSLAALGLSIALLALGPATAADAVEFEFPPGETGYHTYEEMAAEVEAAATAYPSIVQRFSIGRSYQGRELWAAKVSDNVATEEDEPEVLLDGLHHGDEHMSLEMSLAMLRWLTSGYGSDARVTEIVDSREVWIVFMVNPDGGTYNIRNRTYQNWRKNRQPTPRSSFTGTDLNRNYDYRWGYPGGSSSDPRNSRFRGRSAFSAPETRAMRDFVRSRVIDGRQQIRAAISFHTTGRLVLYPYGYTKTNVPSDMTVDDRAAFARLAATMATSSGYRPMQGSDLYLTAGGLSDWLYGRYRVFSFVIELEPSTALYQPDEMIGPETGRNRNAVLHLIEQADCPYRSIGKATTHCGAFFDDLEIDRGWRVNPDGTDTATAGRWARANPSRTYASGWKQRGTTTSGSKALVTGAPAGSTARSYDLDGGRTTVASRPIDLPETLGQRLTFRYYLAHAPDATLADLLRVEILDEGGTATTVLLERAATNNDDAAWASASISLDAWAGTTIRVRATAVDAGRASLVEAAIDDVRVTRG